MLEHLQHFLQNAPVIRGIYWRVLPRVERFKGLCRSVGFRVLRRRPSLNAASVQDILSTLLPRSDDSESISGRALIHIAFHFDRGRLPYLREILLNLASYPFKSSTIVLDTNSPQTGRALQDLDCEIEIHHFPDLPHPHLLTWACRQHFKESVNNYEYFLYLEDDILIPRQAILRWFREKEALKAHGFWPGFLRVELDRRKELVASDFKDQATSPKIVEIQGAKYLSPPFEYQACWVYDRDMLSAFLNSGLFDMPSAKAAETQDVRAIAALGMTFSSPPKGFASRHLLPLTNDCRISPEAFVFHLPSNYGSKFGKRPGDLATLRVRDLVAPAQQSQ